MSKVNPRNKDADIELYLSSLKEKLMKAEAPKEKFNNLINSERKALYDLKNDENIEIKTADKSEEVFNDAAPLLKIINAVIAKIRKWGDL